MSPAWRSEFWGVVSLVVGALVLGLLVGQTIFLLFFAILTYLSWHLYHLYCLERWFIERKKKFPLPEAPGIWGEIFYYLHRLQQRNRKHKNKLSVLLKRFRSSTTAMPDAAVVLGKNNEIEWSNRSAHHLLGLQSPIDRGKPITNLIRSPVFHQYLTNSSDKTSIKLASPIDHKMMLRISIVPYAGHQHLLLARDITQLHHLEQIRRDFVANFSHELRTPLTVITGFIETMRDDNNHEEWQRPLLLMAQQATRMRDLVDDLLLLSRLESGPPLAMAQPIAIKNMLNTLQEEAYLLSGDKDHRIILEMDDDLTIYGYVEELRSAFSNLISNAVRYTPTGGDIKIRWYEDNQGIHFEVQDTGEGIAPEHLPRLTERFYRVDVGRSRSQGGTGLGLAIVKYVLKRHQGYLHIESTLEVGSTFRCDFPTNLKEPLDESMRLSDWDG